MSARHPSLFGEPAEAAEPPPSQVKALSLWQPWAWLVAHGHKLVENRTWSATPGQIKPGERFAIHASKRKPSKDDFPDLVEEIGERGIFLPPVDDLGYGVVLGTVRLVRFVRDAGEIDPSQRGWWCGPVGWIVDDVRPLAAPVPCVGRQGVFRLPEEVANLMEFSS